MPKVIRAVFFLLSLGVSVLPSEPSVAAPVEVVIGVSNGLAPRIIQTLKKYPDACAQDDFFTKDWLRTTLEFFIVCRAIRIGGVEATYSFRNHPNSARARTELLTGSVMIMVDLPWGDFSSNKNLHKSAVVLPVGSFVKGLYTRPDHAAMLKVRTLEELRKFTAVSSSSWKYDWAALERMGLKKIDVAEYTQMGTMVKYGHADFFVGEFPGAKDLAQYIDGERFIPVPGLKVVLAGSRHVAVSKKFPHSKQVFDALQIGLKEMHDRGLIKKGYRISGFFNPSIENWKVLCCE